MAHFFTIIHQQIAKNCKKVTKNIFELNYRPGNVKEIKKTVFI